MDQRAASMPAPEPAEPGGAPATAPIAVARPDRRRAPLVFASPHSGRDYPDAFVRQSRLDALTLRRSEDCFVDELFAGAVPRGAPLLTARFPRAYCDANRAPDELDQAVFAEPVPPSANTRTPRVAAGLGVIARVVKDGADIYAAKLPLAEARARLDRCYAPYHAALSGLIDETCAAYGVCILVDCHSMPGQMPHLHGLRGPAPDVVIGDRSARPARPN